ncbi:MAG: protein translocase subunit SecD [Chloroflexi bacterium]|nr:protein translocase subunit SecD [Chloroflexota bacterium]
MQRNTHLLIFIVILAIVAIWVDLPTNPGIHIDFAGIKISRDIKVHEGLDLQGGLQVILQAKESEDTPANAETMAAAKGIVENRVNALGVSEPLIQLQGSNRIIVELPGIKDPAQAIQTFGRTGLLEFIDAGSTFLPDGTIVTTTLGGPASLATGEETLPLAPTTPLTPTVAPTLAPTSAPTPTLAVTPTTELTATAAATTTVPVTTTATLTPTLPPPTIYRTVITGRLLKTADVSFDETGKPQIHFSLQKVGNEPQDDGPKLFGDFTSQNVGKFLAIVLDKRVISCPTIQSPITDGEGRITGKFTLQEAKNMVIVLKYGALPVPLEVVENRTVGPTLGQDSVRKSVVAGAIGLLIVMAFMLIYYRLPGFLADVALLLYAAMVFALFKLIPVTLTLPGIAGFILSIGMAIDANILIFERMKEELRWGKTLGAAIEAGFARAWTSIRDSNFSTMITCAILFWFGMNFGASIIRGFALTLFIGVAVSMFTAITVTRTFLRAIVNTEYAKSRWAFGLPPEKVEEV